MASVEVKGGAAREIHVDLDRARIDALGIVAGAIVEQRSRAANLTVPAGHYDEGHARDQRAHRRRARERRRRSATSSSPPPRTARRVRLSRRRHASRTASRSCARACAPTATSAVSFERAQAVGHEHGRRRPTRCKAKLAKLEQHVPGGRVEPRSSSIRRASSSENAHEVEVAIVFGGAMAILIILIFMLDLRSTLISAVALPTQRHRHVLRHVRARLHAEHDDAARPVARDRPPHRRRGRRAREHLQAPRARQDRRASGARRHQGDRARRCSRRRSPSSRCSCRSRS